MPSVLLLLAAVLFLAWAIAITLYMNKILNEKLAYTKLPIDNLKDEWKPFTRFDRNNWRELEIYLGAIFLLPIRFALTTLAVMTLATVCYLLRYDSAAKANTEFPYYKRLAVRITARLSARTILLFSGFYWISTKRRKISEFDSSYPEARYANRPRDTATIIVSNHVGWTDIMAILGVWNQAPSFLSKAEVINYPFFGRAAIGLQSIFVDRNSEKARIEVLEQILQRGKMHSEGRNVPPIVIFPEGTTNNTRYLLSFKKGAFEPFMPIKILLLKYEDRYFNPALDSIPLPYHYMLLLCQFKNVLHAEEFETYYPDHLELKVPEDWERYAKAIRNIMVKGLNIIDTNYGFRNFKDYDTYTKNQNRELLAAKRGKKIQDKPAKSE